jgi:hypothetical protein
VPTGSAAARITGELQQTIDKLDPLPAPSPILLGWAAANCGPALPLLSFAA